MKSFLWLLFLVVLGMGIYFGHEYYARERQASALRRQEEQRHLERMARLAEFPELQKALAPLLANPSLPDETALKGFVAAAEVFETPGPVQTALDDLAVLSRAVRTPRDADKLPGLPDDARKEVLCSQCNGRGFVRASGAVLGSQMEDRNRSCPVCKGQKTAGRKFDLMRGQVAAEARVAVLKSWVKGLADEYSAGTSEP